MFWGGVSWSGEFWVAVLRSRLSISNSEWELAFRVLPSEEVWRERRDWSEWEERGVAGGASREVELAKLSLSSFTIDKEGMREG